MFDDTVEQEIHETTKRFVEVFQDDNNPETYAVGLVDEEGTELLWSEGSPATIIAVARKLEEIAKIIERNKFGTVMLNLEEVQGRTQRHKMTVRLALQDGALHGTQDYFSGAWSVESGCADAWAAGLVCTHRLGEMK